MVDGTAIFTTDGQVVSSGKVDINTYPVMVRPTLTGFSGYHWVIGGSVIYWPYIIEMQVDYVRTYCPGCN